MDPGNVAAVSALFGSAIGALASLATSWSTHHYQDERQRSARENVRRERIFVEFIDSASKAFVEALMQTAIEDPSRLIPLYATIGKLRLFASARTVEAAEQVMNRLVATYYAPKLNFHARPEVDHSIDILREFAESCRVELR